MGESRDIKLETRLVFRAQKLRGLSKDWRFRRLKNKGKPGRTACLSLKWLPAKAGLHVGIVVSKKVGKAVVRNRVRRRVREALRRMDLPPLEAVVIANPEAANARYGDIVRALYRAMKKAGL
ncbi:MAG: ribonuclease P protein component [Deinococcales bacterium]